MHLDWNPSTKAFVLRVERNEADIQELMTDHGLDLSLPASTPETAVLFTREPYAAVGFWDCASDTAKHEMRHIQTQIDKSWAQDSSRQILVPPDLELAGFQKAGVSYALDRQHTLIGDQPGLGKTMQAIAFANEIQAERVLLLCPANIRLQWYARIQTWSTMRGQYTIHPILHGRHGVHPTAAWTICSYDLCRTAPIWKALAKLDFDLLILDEAHYLKTYDAARTRSVFGGGVDPIAEAVATRAGRIVALTGTPLPNRPREAYTLSRGLCWDSMDWMSEAKFEDRFNPSIQRESASGKLYIDERTGRHAELQARLRSNFMVRRLKRDVLPQLKLPLLDIVHVEETGAVKNALKAEKLLDIDPENLEGLDMKVMGEVSTVRRMMGIAIAPLAVDYVDMLLDGGEEKICVFAWHTQVLDILMKGLAQYNPLRIDGSTPASRKPKLIEQFKQPQHRIMMGNILSLGTGTDGLQEICQRGVATEASWVPGDNEQMIDRLDRMGQTGTVQFDFLVARGSFSEHVLGSSLRKRQTTHRALDMRRVNVVADDW